MGIEQLLVDYRKNPDVSGDEDNADQASKAAPSSAPAGVSKAAKKPAKVAADSDTESESEDDDDIWGSSDASSDESDEVRSTRREESLRCRRSRWVDTQRQTS